MSLFLTVLLVLIMNGRWVYHQALFHKVAKVQSKVLAIF